MAYMDLTWSDEEVDAEGEDCIDSSDIDIYIVAPSGRTFVLSHWRFDTINHVKAKIQEKEDIAPASQIIMREGEVFDGQWTLAHLKIGHGEFLVCLRASSEASSFSSAVTAATTITTMSDRLFAENQALRRALHGVQRVASQNNVHDMLFVDGDDQAP
jgi:hypothetical protein